MFNPIIDPCMDVARFMETATYRRTPEFITPNRIVHEDKAVILRRFDEGRAGPPLLIVPPQAGHHSSIADYAPEQSLVRTCLKETALPVYVLEWKPSTPTRQHETIDDLVLQLRLCVHDAGEPVILIGLCQGGWLSAIYAALYPQDVKALLLAAAPIDFTAGGGKLQDVVQTMPIDFYRWLVTMGFGNMMGDLMLMGWKVMNPYERFVSDFINLWVNVRDDKYLERSKQFQTWYEYTQNISGKWYLQAVDKLFKKNMLIDGKLRVLKRMVDLGTITCPVAMLAGEKDDITLVPQLFNMSSHIATPPEDIFQTVVEDAGHISVFMGRTALKSHWPPALRFTLEKVGLPGALTYGTSSRRMSDPGPGVNAP
ncbi:MAG TPA: alpha/beta fold hydrolase [Deltaproteobacteria bacterium]|nr:alpha/beta fold hydrolase [Deltaproteobacteria bacterium]HPR55529.1 alpha/beta fold hydrolase [Deltaproteobacteria bacterium]HXK48347.1 alpha/beta fold hydrolase [Deltaproteobacteria bacterium]